MSIQEVSPNSSPSCFIIITRCWLLTSAMRMDLIPIRGATSGRGAASNGCRRAVGAAGIGILYGRRERPETVFCKAGASGVGLLMQTSIAAT